MQYHKTYFICNEHKYTSWQKLIKISDITTIAWLSTIEKLQNTQRYDRKHNKVQTPISDNTARKSGTKFVESAWSAASTGDRVLMKGEMCQFYSVYFFSIRLYPKFLCWIPMGLNPFSAFRFWAKRKIYRFYNDVSFLYPYSKIL